MIMADWTLPEADEGLEADIVLIDAARVLERRGLLTTEELERVEKQMDLGLWLREQELEFAARRRRTEQALKMERLRDAQEFRMQCWRDRRERQERREIHAVRLAEAWVTVSRRAGLALALVVTVIIAVLVGGWPADVLRALGWS